ncbi:MAG TPA: DNA (cytosine-5-)-methyltransferase [Cyclobacteriaceae bacterium]
MRHLDLFSGVGGFALAARWMGWETIQFVEIDKFCQEVLNKNFPNVPIHGDIKTFDGSKYRGAVDILTGGFPCQKFSLSGKGSADLTEWKEMFRVIGEIQPTVVLVENVYGLLVRKFGMAFETVCADLETSGYEIQSFIIPACAIDAPHKRERIWICAYSEIFGRERLLCDFIKTSEIKGERNSKERAPLGSRCNPFLQFEQSVGEPPIFGVDDGLPNRVDRLGSVGNSIHPQVAFEIFKAIELSFLPRDI